RADFFKWQQWFITAAPGGAFLIDLHHSSVVASKCNARAVGRPDGGRINLRSKSEAGGATARQVGQPDIRIRDLRRHQGGSQPVFIGGESEIRVVPLAADR